MPNTSKQISNPFSTGGGGSHFEAYVQASFVVIMLANGFVPCIPNSVIKKIKLQGKFAGYETDDMIVFAENVGSGQACKVIAQIKHSINITKKDNTFRDVIQCAWNDFNNPTIFSKNKDAIALITGPLSATDINDARFILEWARSSESSDEFFNKVRKTNFSSQAKRSKLAVFQENLKHANNGNPVTEEQLFEFLKHFHLIGYDLDVKSGVILSMLHSIIGFFSERNVPDMWARILDEVFAANKSAGTITFESLPEDLCEPFRFTGTGISSNKEAPSSLELKGYHWNEQSFGTELVIANLIGSWNGKNPNDLDIIQQVANQDYDHWSSNLATIIHSQSSQLTVRNDKWSVIERIRLWDDLGSRLFDKNLERFMKSAITVLSEHDPMLQLPVEERFTAILNGKVLKYSHEIRKGIAETLALLGNRAKSLPNCSLNYPETIAVLTVREIFQNSDWELWISLDNLLSLLAEAAPDEFLKWVEHALQQNPCPFKFVFSQERNGITGKNYLTGLLWALETLAWEEEFLVRVSLILGELATLDPGGSWANRPSASLTTIFLPWYPQTTASTYKRLISIQTLQKEFPEVAWKLIVSLLPNQHQLSSGTHKPLWRQIAVSEEDRRVTIPDYWEQIFAFVDLSLTMSGDDIGKLSELINHFDDLPEDCIEKILKELEAENIIDKYEEARLPLWNNLVGFITNKMRYPDTNWPLDSEKFIHIKEVANKLAPTNPSFLYRRLFSNRDHDLYDENGDWEKQSQKLNDIRFQAIKEIFERGGLGEIISFANQVESPGTVGYSFGFIEDSIIDSQLLPLLLEPNNNKVTEFVGRFIWSRHRNFGWSWVDAVDMSTWSAQHIGMFLSHLPFTGETWKRVYTLLDGSDGEYWSRVNVNPYQTEDDLFEAIDKLIEHKRPNSAIDCLYKLHLDKKPLNVALTIRCLNSVILCQEPSYGLDQYHVVELIKALQNNPNIDPEDMVQVEWIFLPLLSVEHDNAAPRFIEKRLAEDPNFFCEIIALVYRSNKNGNSKNDLTEKEKSLAINAWNLLHRWRTPPGLQANGYISGDFLRNWIEQVKEKCNTSGHLEVALRQIGKVLFYSPPDPQGLWIDTTVAEILNSRDANEMREGYTTEVINSRGVYWVDPTGKPERDLASQFRQKADDTENAGLQRLATTLRRISESYDREADQIINDHEKGE